MTFCGPGGEIKPNCRPERKSVAIAAEWGTRLSFTSRFGAYAAGWLIVLTHTLRMLGYMVTFLHLYSFLPCL